MLGRELRVEQPESADPQASEQMDERDFRSVAGAMEHALAEECATQANAVKTPDKLVLFVCFD